LRFAKEKLDLAFAMAVAAILSLTVLPASGGSPSEANSTYFDLRVPHPFTSPDGGQTRCFDVDHCYGPPPGGWAWQAEDVGKFDASTPLPPFDPNHPQPYRSRDGGQTRCFIGYGCKGPPPGGWLWTESGDAQATWYQKLWSWIRGAVVPWTRDVGLPATNEALQQGLPDPISIPLSGVDMSIAMTEFLQKIEKDGNAQLIEIEVSGVCPAKTCSKNAIADAANDLSNFSFMGTGNIAKAFSVANMSHAQYGSYVQSIVAEWARQAGYTVN
jgi:hypothetical protein